MLLYIVRHAAAGQHGDPRYPDDSQRPLTEKGRKRFSRLVKRLAKRGFAPTLIVTSPFVRCLQTAQAILDRLDNQPLLLDLNELEPGSELAALVTWTNGRSEEEIAWVGHAPDVERLAGGLVGDESADIRFAKGAIAAIEFPGEVTIGGGQLLWLITPKLVD